MKKNLLWLVLAFVSITGYYGCTSDDDLQIADRVQVKDYDHQILSAWNEKFLAVERYATNCRPGPAPRFTAYIGLATYEACIQGMPSYRSLKNRFPGLQIPAIDATATYDYPTVVNNVYGTLLYRFMQNVDMAPEHLLTIVAHKANTNNTLDANVADDVFNRSKQYGEAVANAVYEWSATDTYGHEAFLDPNRNYDYSQNLGQPALGYTPGHGLWVPTSTNGIGMFNYWGNVRTFAIDEAIKICQPPLPYTAEPNTPLHVQAMEVYNRTVNQSLEDAHIATFWSDDLTNLTFSPPMRWLAIADQVYRQSAVDLETAIYTNAKVGLAINDAGVACWHSKYYYNVERPISYIRREIDPTWETALSNPQTGQQNITPSFPAYPSGHSTFGAAAAEVLTDIYGINYALVDRCHQFREEFDGRPRSFQSFNEMAWENAMSRIPLGVHFLMDCEEGYFLGARCGRAVNRLPWKK